MKKLIFSFLAILFLFTFGFCQDGQRIGKVIGGKYVITENIDNIKILWNKTLKDKKIDGELTSFAIEVGVDDDNYTYIYLSGKNSQSNVTTVQLLVFDSNREYLYLAMDDGAGHTVTCSGCTVGCSPKYFKRTDSWACINGCVGCSKSETTTY